MSILLIIIAFLVVYAVVGCFFRAAYICKHTRSNGTLPFWEKESATELGFIWPMYLLYLVVMVVRRVILWPAIHLARLSDFMVKICFRIKTGRDPTNY
jgi:hypothetical protein